MTVIDTDASSGRAVENPWSGLFCDRAGSLAVSSGSSLFVVPTTRDTLGAVEHWRRGGVLPVGTLEGHGLATPLELVRALNDGRPLRAALFSDQLVTALHAPLPVSVSGRILYVSSIELTAHQVHRARVCIWSGSGFVSLAADTTSARLLRTQIEYLQACEQLGTEWIAGPVQITRTHSYRTADADRRLRLLQSVLLYSCAKGTPYAAHETQLTRIAGLRKQLAARTT